MATSFTPNSKVRLIKNVPLDKSYTNTMSHNFSKNVQLSYFLSLPNKLYDSLTFTKKDLNTIRVKDNAETLYQYNYLMFQNANYGDKWFYAFILEHKYINPNLTELVYEIDVMQTWLTEIDIKQSFVMREHCSQTLTKENLNTIPENLEIGTEYVTSNVETINVDSDKFKCLIIVCTDYLTITDDNEYHGGKYSGVIDPLIYYFVPIRVDSYQKEILVNGEFLYNPEYITYNSLLEGNANKIISMFYIPFIPFNYTTTISSNSANIESTHLLNEKLIGGDENAPAVISRILSFAQSEMSIDVTSDRYSKFPNFSEIKMYTYPYSYIEIDSGFGDKLILKNEYFSSDKKLNVKLRSTISSVPKSIYQVTGYKGTNPYTTLDESVITTSTGDVPIINDYSASYLQGQRNSLISSAVFGTIGGVATAGVGVAMLSNPLTASMGTSLASGGVISAANAIGSALSKVADISNVPNNLKQQAINGTTNYALGLNVPTVRFKTISEEYRTQIQSYWKAYGYAVNKIKLPNLNTRSAFNFVQMLRPTIFGSIPQSDLEIIIKNFERGITIWHNQNIGNYTQTNS